MRGPGGGGGRRARRRDHFRVAGSALWGGRPGVGGVPAPPPCSRAVPGLVPPFCPFSVRWQRLRSVYVVKGLLLLLLLYCFLALRDRAGELAMWAIVTAPVALLQVPPKVYTCLEQIH